MKKIVLTTLITIFITIFCFSQDTITKKTGKNIQAKVIEITTKEVKYKRFDNQDGPIYNIDKSEVLMIKYANGVKDTFNIVGVKENKKNEGGNEKVNKSVYIFEPLNEQEQRHISSVINLLEKYGYQIVKDKNESEFSLEFRIDGGTFVSASITLFKDHSELIKAKSTNPGFGTWLA